MSGFLCVLKPPGMTSSDVVVRVRRKLGGKVKVGHAGTLDPEAAGVLPLMVGKAARLFDYLVEKEKTYVAQLRPGYSTDTQDAHGAIVGGGGQMATRAQLDAVLPRFIGEIQQIPPMYSALKRDGQKLCDLARQGVVVEVAPRPTQVHAIDVLAEEDCGFLLRIRCGRGTYIRTLCHDIGMAMGTHAHMGMLLRTQTGAFAIKNAVTIEEIDAVQTLMPLLIPMDEPLAHMPAVRVLPKAERFVRNGNVIMPDELENPVAADTRVRVYLDDCFCGIGHMQEQGLKFDAMLL